MKRTFAAAAIVALSASGALGADLGADPFRSPAFKAVPFAGAYAGVQFGGDVESMSVDGADGLALGARGVHAGVTIGYDTNLGSTWVAGVYASGNYNDIGVHYGEASIEQRWTAKLGGRIGPRIENTLFYVPVAYTMDWQSMSVVDGDDFVGGVFTGLGVEHQFSNGWSLGVEAGVKFVDQDIENVGVDRRSMSAELTLRRRF